MNKTCSAMGAAVLLAFGVLGAGCADGGQDESDQGVEASEGVNTSPENLVASVNAQGFTVKIYEPTPGVLVEEEHGNSDEALHYSNDHDLDIVQRYELLSGQKAPAALLAAAKRANEETHEDEAVPEPSRDKANLYTDNEQWILDTFCKKTGNDTFWKGNFFGSSSWSKRVEYMYAIAWVQLGSVWYDVSYSGAGSWSWFLKSHEYNGRRCTSAINRAASSTVRSSVQVDQVHHCVNYDT